MFLIKGEVNVHLCVFVHLQQSTSVHRKTCHDLNELTLLGGVFIFESVTQANIVTVYRKIESHYNLKNIIYYCDDMSNKYLNYAVNVFILLEKVFIQKQKFLGSQATLFLFLNEFNL